MIPEEAWTGRRQDLSHVRIFGSLALANILVEKRSKSDYQKVWEGILIGYSPDASKHFRVWAPQTRQVIIASDPYIDESEQGARLLAKWPLETSPTLKRKAPTGEPRPRGRPRKKQALIGPPTEITTAEQDEVDEEVVTGKEQEHEVAMSITESSSKIHEPKTYNEAVNDLAHGRQW